MDIAIAKDRLASVVKPDSITASQGDFLATHVAIKKLVMLNKFLISSLWHDALLPSANDILSISQVGEILCIFLHNSLHFRFYFMQNSSPDH